MPGWAELLQSQNAQVKILKDDFQVKVQMEEDI